MLFATSNLGYGQLSVELPKPSPIATVEQRIGYTEFTIKYSRPSKRERKIFGGLVPYNKRWRTGANARTNLSASTSFVIGKDTIPAGDYAIFTIPYEKHWDIILYSEHKGWGLMRNWDESKIVSKTKHKVKTLQDTIETFTIDFSDLNNFNIVNLNLSWENTRVSIPVKLPTEKISERKINDFLSPHEVNYRGIAVFYLTNDIKLSEVIKISDKVVEMNQGTIDGFWGYHFKAMAYRKLGNTQKKVDTIKKGIKYVNGLDIPEESKEWCRSVLNENIML